MPSSEVTQLLHDLRCGDASAVDRLLPVVYEELHAVARRLMHGERTGHTLQPTALVHEAYLRLVGGELDAQDRGHFIGIAARAMRQILVNHALAKRAQKRGGGCAAQPLDEVLAAFETRAFDMIALDEALKSLAELDPDQARIVECRFFAGQSMEEIAALLEAPLRSVERDWSLARAWLRRELGGGMVDDA